MKKLATFYSNYASGSHSGEGPFNVCSIKEGTGYVLKMYYKHWNNCNMVPKNSRALQILPECR